mmetsp:Transcript_18911/g.30561  ORF Transcript_18911/g.30561 Transcript_18911/m.30561 type:complete len:124 (+) Transcript_18911:64-435(+)
MIIDRQLISSMGVMEKNDNSSIKSSNSSTQSSDSDHHFTPWDESEFGIELLDSASTSSWARGNTHDVVGRATNVVDSRRHRHHQRERQRHTPSALCKAKASPSSSSFLLSLLTKLGSSSLQIR